MAKEAKASTKVVEMEQDKVCKSCVRYKGIGKEADTVIATVYVQNAAFEALGAPDKITVSISPV